MLILIKCKKWVLAFCIILILILQYEENVTAQSLNGTTGLVTIPTAEMPKDREISFGLNLINKKYCDYGENKYHGVVKSISLGYLPFLEISPRLTRHLDLPKPQALGDRTVSIRLRTFKENVFFPSIVLGVQDPFGDSKCFNSTYIVASKKFHLLYVTTSLHFGYGVDWIEARQYQFVGLFGGCSLSISPSIAFLLEYDTERYNFGTRISILDHLQILLSLQNFDAFSGGVSYKFRL